MTTVPDKGYLLIWADNETGIGLHAPFKLSAGGEEIGLYDTTANGQELIDSMVFKNQETDISYGRYVDGTDNLRFFGTPTPLAANDGAYIDEVADTRFNYTRGFYADPINVAIGCDTPGATIYYTTSGSAPIETSAIYSGPIPISSSTCLRARAYKAGWLETDIDTQTYIFGATDAIKSLPVFSIVGDEQQSLFEPNGIMAIVGGNYSGGAWNPDGPDSDNNPMQRGIGYERPVSLEILDSESSMHSQINSGIRVAGSDYHRPRYTRGNNWDYNFDKFSFKFFFRTAYGDNEFNYPLFPFADTDTFKSIMLRGGHNDVHNPFIKDEMLRRLHKDMGGIAVTGTVANLFINGEYKSFYNPCERLDEDFFKNYFNVDTDWDVITQRAVRNGDSIEWDTALDFIRNNDLANDTKYIQAAEMLDIVDFIDYLIIQLYSGNWDWPGNNWTVSRERTPEGKFRFHCWDVEGAMESGRLNQFGFDDFPIWWPAGSRGLNDMETQMSWIYRGLKANSEFKVLFADRIQKHFYYDGALVSANLERRFNELREKMSTRLPNMDTSVLTTWIPNRHQIMLDKFADEDLYASPGPTFLVNGTPQHGGYVSSGDAITITPTGAWGTTYYTTDGTDPRTWITKTPGSPPFNTVLVSEGAAKKVLIPSSPVSDDWKGGNEPFSDSSWIYYNFIAGKTGGVGYERDTGYEGFISYDVAPGLYTNNNTQSCLIRIPFSVDAGQLQDMTYLTLRMRHDDAFVAYINGTEVYQSSQVPDPLEWNSSSSGAGTEAANLINYDISSHLPMLQAGSDNILAIHGLNSGPTSSDFLISVLLEAGALGSGGTAPGGAISPSAIEYTGDFSFSQSSQLKSRFLMPSGLWSALHEASYAVGPVAESLRVSEVMYHPVDPNEEFIEIINVGSQSINLNLVEFTKGISFTVGSETLSPDERVVLVRNQTAFMNRYPSFTGRIIGQYEGSLDNGGEKIILQDAAKTAIQEFTYKDGWYDITDGQGYSLTVRDPYSSDPNDWSIKEGWRSSAAVGGTPGTDDSGVLPDTGAIVINEVLAHSDTVAYDWIELYNTTSATIDIGGWFLSDSGSDDPNLMKYEIAAGETITGHGYKVFYENLHFGAASSDPGRRIPFAL
ncbi:MAG: lamin tail domain-containing protein, partial [Planctomycetota bacterium]